MLFCLSTAAENFLRALSDARSPSAMLSMELRQLFFSIAMATQDGCLEMTLGCLATSGDIYATVIRVL